MRVNLLSLAAALALGIRGDIIAATVQFIETAQEVTELDWPHIALELDVPLASGGSVLSRKKS